MASAILRSPAFSEHSPHLAAAPDGNQEIDPFISWVGATPQRRKIVPALPMRGLLTGSHWRGGSSVGTTISRPPTPHQPRIRPASPGCLVAGSRLPRQVKPDKFRAVKRVSRKTGPKASWQWMARPLQVFSPERRSSTDCQTYQEHGGPFRPHRHQPDHAPDSTERGGYDSRNGSDNATEAVTSFREGVPRIGYAAVVSNREAAHLDEGEVRSDGRHSEGRLSPVTLGRRVAGERM